MVQQGSFVVLRDEQNRPIAKQLVVKTDNRTWREALKKLTNDGADIHEVLYNLAMGTPQVVKLEDGRESEPIVPSPEVRRAAAMDLHRIMHGKEVAETEVIKAEEEAHKMRALSAMSDHDILRELKPLLQGNEFAQFTEGDESDESDPASPDDA